LFFSNGWLKWNKDVFSQQVRRTSLRRNYFWSKVITTHQATTSGVIFSSKRGNRWEGNKQYIDSGHVDGIGMTNLRETPKELFLHKSKNTSP